MDTGRDNRIIGMYVHQHWPYNHPYCARTWTIEDWRGYAEGLRRLGYNTILFWPILEIIPDPPTPSDIAYLDRSARVVTLLHDMGMRVYIALCPNVVPVDDEAARAPIERRHFFYCDRRVNPADPEDMADMLRRRELLLGKLREVDGVSIIDSDPGGFIGSSNAEFVELLRLKLTALRELSPNVELYYWMHVGWENYNRFWAEARTWQDPTSHPPIRWDLDVFTETLRLMVERVPEPWGVFVNHPNHFAATEQLGLAAKRLHVPYGAVEGEPTFPLTNWKPALLDEALNHPFAGFRAESVPRGRMGNAQTHCLQLPHTYLFAHLARGGTLETADLEGFAGDLLPDCAALIAQAWLALETGDVDRQLALAARLEDEAAPEQRLGRLKGLLFGDPARFLTDLAMNLRVRARLAELDGAIASRSGIGATVEAFLRDFRPYQQRLGFRDAYGGPLYTALNERLMALGDAGLGRALKDFLNWADPSVRNGALVRLLDALEEFAGRCKQGGAAPGTC